MIKKITTVLAISIFLFGCSGSPSRESYSYRNDIQPGNDLYALLEKTDDGYRFTRFSTTFVKNEPWIRVNDGKPMWNNRISSPCSKGLVAFPQKCEYEDESRFISFSTNLGRSTLTTLLTGGFGLIFVPMGEVAFDNEAYTDALEEAGGLSQFDAYMSDYEKAISDRYQTYKQVKDRYNTIIASLSKEVVIADKSGLLTDKKFLNQRVSVSENRLNNPSHITVENVSALISAIQEDHQKLSKEWNKYTSYVNVRCRHSSPYNGFHFTLDCPNKAVINNGKLIINAKAVVTSKDFEHLIPNQLNASDDAISINLNGNAISMTNSTSNFITIDSISFYYNGNISTVNQLNRELPPESDVNVFRLSSLQIDWSKLNFKEVTRNTASSHKIEYGFAVKYRIANTGKGKTLYRVKSYMMSDLI